MQPTPYHDVNETILFLLEQQRQVLGDRLVGLYLGGSLGLGDFDPGSSDIDWLAVTDKPLPEPLLLELQAVHDQVRATGWHWAQHLEGSYIPVASVRRYDPSDSDHPSVGVDWAFGIHHHDAATVIQNWIFREKGITVWGPPPATLIDPISVQEVQDAVAGLLRDVWAARLLSPEWLRPRNYQAYAVLSMCRARQTLLTGALSSKPVAAAWARAALPQWAPLIDRALSWRSDTSPDDMTEMLAFVRETVELV